MTEAELAELDDPDAPNLPERMQGHQGSMPNVSVTEQRKRRALMSSLLSQGTAREMIYNAFDQQFGMTQPATQLLIREVQTMWETEDEEDARYLRSMTTRRVLDEIREARKDRKWSAVAKLEGVLADVQGTNVKEDEAPINVDSRLSDAILSILGASDTTEVKLLIESERMFIELGNQKPGMMRAPVEARVDKVVDALPEPPPPPRKRRRKAPSAEETR